jgi:uncharacterized membrane protein
MFCHSCGSQVPSDVQFCPGCGQALAAPAGPPPVLPIYVPPTGVTAKPGAWIGAGWDMVKADLGNYVLVGLIFIVLNGVVPLILQGPLLVGFHLYCIKRLAGRNAEIGDLFKGFNYFVPALVASILIAIFSAVGFVLCIIPGLVVAAMYKFTYLFVLDKRMDFWPAMQASHAVVRNDYFGFTMFLILMALVNILGALCCIVGILVSIPVTVAAITVAYRELVGFEPSTADIV